MAHYCSCVLDLSRLGASWASTLKGTAYRAATFAAMFCAGVALAHHSISVIEIGSPQWVKGTVARYEASRWLDLVNSEPMGREYWCNSRRFSNVASVAPKPLMDKVDREMTAPCD